MTKAQKQQAIQQLAASLQHNHFYLADSQGLNAQEVSHLRHACFEAGIQYTIVKNTLLLKALQQINNPHLDLETVLSQALKGPTSLFIIQANPSTPAKVIQAFHKKNKQKTPTLKAAFVYEDLLIGKQHLKALSSLKSKEELIAQLIQLLQAPAQNLLSALQNTGDSLTGSLKTLAQKGNSQPKDQPAN